MTRKTTPLLLLLFFIIACNKDTQQEQEQFEAREKALIIREEQFAEKEADYKSLVKLRDSLTATKVNKADTLPVLKTWPDSLQSAWSSKMICRESNCGNYVIGDQRNETWEFKSDSTGIYTNVINNKKLVRIFKANYSGDKIKLNFISDSTSANKTNMNVVLDEIKKNVMKGTQTITAQNNCTAKFSVELTPAPKK